MDFKSAINDLSRQMKETSVGDAPPSYEEAIAFEDHDPNLPSSFQVETHLKLLFAFHRLRESVVNDSSMLGIDDSWFFREGHWNTDDIVKARQTMAEVRWELYVKRAVLRFETWWCHMKDTARQNNTARKITIGDLTAPVPFSLMTDNKFGMSTAGTISLPPLDVLMVWHSFLLSPRKYLEDCLLQGMMSMWYMDFPWQEVDNAINAESGEYDPSAEHQSAFTKIIPWSNIEDDCKRKITCPHCKTVVKVSDSLLPTLILEVKKKYVRGMGLSPMTITKTINEVLKECKGWADAGFKYTCPNTSCKKLINNDVLCAGKFFGDVLAYRPRTSFPLPDSLDSAQFKLISNLSPMPGTVLSATTGLPQTLGTVNRSPIPGDDFVRKPEFTPITLAATLSHVDKDGTTGTTPQLDPFTMAGVRSTVSKLLDSRHQMLYATNKKQRRATKLQRPPVRRTMAYYNENPSIFTMDLASAVHRQSNFIVKMQQIDWLHSPALSSTASRVIAKYTRFMTLIAKFPQEMAVPTLDIDLAWHTNQLSPSSYFRYCMMKTKGRKFVDHDDKVSSQHLSTSFATTSKNYQRLFNEPYSECTCWYCEAMHASISRFPGRFLLPNSASGYRRPSVSSPISSPPLSRVTSPNFNPDQKEMDMDTQTDSSRATPSGGETHTPSLYTGEDHSRTAHISSHNVIDLQNPPEAYKTKMAKHLAWLEKAYTRACERAKKEGRPPPARRHVSPSNSSSQTSNVYAHNNNDGRYQPVILDPMGFPITSTGGKGGGISNKGLALGAAAGLGIGAVGVTAIVLTADGGLGFEGQPEEVDHSRAGNGAGGCGGGGGCVSGTCGGGVAWGGCSNDAGGDVGGLTCSSSSGGACSADASSSCGGGCGGGCGGCGG